MSSFRSSFLTEGILDIFCKETGIKAPLASTIARIIKWLKGKKKREKVRRKNFILTMLSRGYQAGAQGNLWRNS